MYIIPISEEVTIYDLMDNLYLDFKEDGKLHTVPLTFASRIPQSFGNLGDVYFVVNESGKIAGVFSPSEHKIGINQAMIEALFQSADYVRTYNKPKDVVIPFDTEYLKENVVLNKGNNTIYVSHDIDGVGDCSLYIGTYDKWGGGQLRLFGDGYDMTLSSDGLFLYSSEYGGHYIQLIPRERKIIVSSSTENSTKKFAITVNDDGEIKATEYKQ